MAPDLWAVRDHPVQRRCRRDLRRGRVGQPVRRLGAQEPAGAGHIHLRHRRRCDRSGAAGRLGRACDVALRRRLRPDRRGDALSHTGRRDHADALPHRCVQLLRRVRDRRRAAGLGDLGDIAGIAGLARRGDAGCGDDTGRHCDRAGGSGVGAMACRQGALRRGACAGGTTAWSAARAGAVAERADRSRRRPAAWRNCTGTPRASGRR